MTTRVKHNCNRITACALAAVMLSATLPTASAARLNELQHATDKGITDTVSHVAQLDSLKRVLFVGAHPDDETNSLLVYLNRKLGADTIYTTINWGEGGDNSIGNELYGALGALRSQELSSSRMFDGAEQMYGGAVDFGYSVSLRESLLGDPATNADGIYSIDVLGYNLAKIIRSTRPSVIFSNHKAPNYDHGQHRAVGWIIEYAMDLAAKPDYVILGDSGETLAPWQTQKFFTTTPSKPNWVEPAAFKEIMDETTAVGINSAKNPLASDLTLDLGEYDPILGMSYDECGILGRNMHKCQKMIGAPVRGEALRSYILKKSAPGVDTAQNEFSTSVFGGIAADTIETLAIKGQDILLNTILANVQGYQNSFTQKDMKTDAIKLHTAMKAVDRLSSAAAAETDAIASADAAEYARRMSTHINKAVADIYGLAADVTINDTDIVPGQTVSVTATAWARNAKPGEVSLPKSASELLVVPEGWSISQKSGTDMKANGAVVGRQFVCGVTAPANADAYTGPYNAPYNESYTNNAFPNGGVKEGAKRNSPTLAGVADTQDPAQMTGKMVANQNPLEQLEFGVTTKGTDPYSHSPIRARFATKIGGAAYAVEAEPELRLVPKLSVIVSNDASMLKYTGQAIHSTIDVVVRNNLKGEAKNIVVSAAPTDAASGIVVEPQTVNLSQENQTAAVTLKVTVPANYQDKGTELVVTATLNGEKFAEGYQVISYNHINTVNFYKKAVQNVTVAGYRLPSDNIKIGFLRGGSDDFVFDYIRGMYSDSAKADANLKALSASDIAKSGATLKQEFDTIIIGKTALADQSAISGALRGAQQNLLDFANAGGNLVLHYQNWTDAKGLMPLAPTPFPLGNSNINKEDSEVFVSAAAAKTPFYTGVNTIDLMLDGDKSAAPLWDGWTQQRCEWTPGTAAAGQVEAMEQLGYTVLFGGQDPEGQLRPAILYKEMQNGGHYTYSAVVWDRQLQALTPGAYKLYANLISMGAK